MAGLVDYSSDDEAPDPQDPVPETLPLPPPLPALPPLPRAFHDLYASTVRSSITDDPSLHHGRTRAIPHVAGQWPSHVYIEWFPSPAEHASLSRLLAAWEAATEENGSDGRHPSSLSSSSSLHTFLTSDLGAPLPLHISLSRPFVLRSDNKAAFLDHLVDAVTGCVAPFHVALSGLDWYRGPDSARAFLVLRVRSVTAASFSGSGSATGASSFSGSGSAADANPELTALLARCNEQVTAVGQPALYATAEADTAYDSPFHISLAWTLDDAVYQRSAKATARVFAAWQQAENNSTQSTALRVHIDGVKIKIGNVVTHIPLQPDRRRAKRARTSLFGL